jgi:type IV secretion system protein TrbC
MSHKLFNLFFVLGVSVLFIETVNAGSTTGLPWEKPIDTIVSSITGPIAFGVAVLGVAIAGITLSFGGEISDLTRRVMMVVLAVALTVGSASFLRILFGTTGAIIT